MLTKFKKQLRQDGELYLKIKAHPNSPKTEVKDILEDDAVKINIAATPEKNKANTELVKFLAKEFDVNQDSIVIIGGRAERIKLVKVKI
ncbi:MAG: DUF167 domain-containing protein [Patescibacteria group bacterium]|jgi:uncharacterized protein (TIGR00251 family)